MTDAAPLGRSPAQARGDIDAGREGDKTPGIDPAAAPMETDAESAGTAPARDPSRPRETPKFTNQASYGNAMRPLQDEPDVQPRRYGPVLVIAAIVVLAAAVFIGAAMLR
ncbi:hypothetical protein NKI19_14415 [Mesorhizobium sp. M0751]|uniref:hypothetical protein n=1 Tax=unclassified Mesorhizobium TaxID=325217 RepID=UPI00333D4F24